MAEDYSKLHRTYEYDHEKATLLAKATSELVQLEKRKQYLERLLKENRKLTPFLWQTAEGDVIALHDIPQGHFENILKHLTDSGRPISAQLKAEAATRGTPLPDEIMYLPSSISEKMDFSGDDIDDVFERKAR